MPGRCMLRSIDRGATRLASLEGFLLIQVDWRAFVFLKSSIEFVSDGSQFLDDVWALGRKVS